MSSTDDRTPFGIAGVAGVAFDLLADSSPRSGRRTEAARIREMTIGQWYERLSDHSVWQVRNVFRHERRVQLAPDFGGQPQTVTLAELERAYVPRTAA
jgi:hypothetical protein